MRGSEQGVLVALAALAAAALALLWACGALAGALFGSGWAPLPVVALLGTAIRLPSHLADPRDAWPAGMRAELPGAAEFYATAALLLGGLGALAALALHTTAGMEVPLLGARRGRAPAARWARGRDLASLRIGSPQAARLTLGRAGRRLLAARRRESVIVFGPTQTHKTSGLAIPALLEWQGPVLATSVKADLLGETLERRAALGEVMVFDPAQVSGVESSRATPLHGAGSWRGAMEVAHWLVSAARSGAGGLGDADFWYAAAEKLLAPLLFAAASSGHTIEAVVRWLDEGPEPSEAKIEALLEATGEAAARRAYQATQNREERQRSSVYTTAEMILAAYADPRVIEESSGADYTPEKLLDGGANTLYLCAPTHQQERLRTVFSMIVQELVAAVYERSAARGRPLEPPLLLLLDEAANIAPVPNLAEIASTGAGQGVQLLTVFQDMAQVSSRYGARAATIVNNHRAKLFGTAISDAETLAYVSRLIGAGEFEQRSRSSGERGRRSETEGETYRDLAPATVVRERRPGSALLVYGHLPPAQIALRPWYEDRALRALRNPTGGSV